MKLPKFVRPKEQAEKQARFKAAKRRWNSMTQEEQDKEIFDERTRAKWKALDIQLASEDKTPIDVVATETFTSSEIASLPKELFPFVVIQYRNRVFLTCVGNYRTHGDGIACGIATLNPEGLFLAVYDANGKPWPKADDQAKWRHPGLFMHQIIEPGVAAAITHQLGRRINELWL
jgi:hypothetical protein